MLTLLKFLPAKDFMIFHIVSMMFQMKSYPKRPGTRIPVYPCRRLVVCEDLSFKSRNMVKFVPKGGRGHFPMQPLVKSSGLDSEVKGLVLQGRLEARDQISKELTQNTFFVESPGLKSI